MRLNARLFRNEFNIFNYTGARIKVLVNHISIYASSFQNVTKICKPI